MGGEFWLLNCGLEIFILGACFGVDLNRNYDANFGGPGSSGQVQGLKNNSYIKKITLRASFRKIFDFSILKKPVLKHFEDEAFFQKKNLLLKEITLTRTLKISHWKVTLFQIFYFKSNFQPSSPFILMVNIFCIRILMTILLWRRTKLSSIP